MISSNRPPETIFELKKDISTPQSYMRAGIQKTKAEWEELFPRAFVFNNNEWFIDMTPVEEFDYDEANGISKEKRKIMYIVDHVFKEHDLSSMSYREAAILAIEKFKADEMKIDNTVFRNFLRSNHLTKEWEEYLRVNNHTV